MGLNDGEMYVFGPRSDDPWKVTFSEVEVDMMAMQGITVWDIIRMKSRFGAIHGVDDKFYAQFSISQLNDFVSRPIHEQIAIHKKYRIEHICKEDIDD